MLAEFNASGRLGITPISVNPLPTWMKVTYNPELNTSIEMLKVTECTLRQLIGSVGIYGK